MRKASRRKQNRKKYCRNCGSLIDKRNPRRGRYCQNCIDMSVEY